MRYKLTFVAGFGAGYVLGTKAGRKRYETISDGVRRLVDSPVVQEAAGVLQAQASGVLATAKSSVTSRLNDVVGDKVSARLAGVREGHFFGDSHASTPAGAAHDGVDPASAPPYPPAGHEEFGAPS